MYKILCVGDMHLDDKAPVCRKDENYLETIFKKVDFIIETAVEKKVDYIIQTGDMFDKSRPDQAQLLEVMLFERLRKLDNIPFITITGNHDLPYHNLNNIYRSSIGVLDKAGFITLLNEEPLLRNGLHIQGFPYGIDFTQAPNDPAKKIAIIHEYVFERSVPPFMSGETARDIVELNPGWDIIICGHLHQSYIKKVDNTLVINPGCIVRLTGHDQNTQPRLSLLSMGEEITTEWIDIPIIKENVSREHIEANNARDERIELFVEQMESNNIKGLDFEANLEQYFSENKTEKEIKNKIWELVQE